MCVFRELYEGGRLEKISVDADQSDQLLKLLDSVVIKLEGGSDLDLQVNSSVFFFSLSKYVIRCIFLVFSAVYYNLQKLLIPYLLMVCVLCNFRYWIRPLRRSPGQLHLPQDRLRTTMRTRSLSS